MPVLHLRAFMACCRVNLLILIPLGQSVSCLDNSVAGDILFSNLDTLSFESHLMTLNLVQKFQKCGPRTTSPLISVLSRNRYYTFV